MNRIYQLISCSRKKIVVPEPAESEVLERQFAEARAQMIATGKYKHIDAWQKTSRDNTKASVTILHASQR